VVNGTAGIELALKACSVTPGQEVLVPSLTFVATANAIHNIGAIPHFIDVNKKNLGVDPSKLEKHLNDIVDFKNSVMVNKHTGRKIGCLIVMHTFGHSVDMDGIMQVARKFDLPVIEDAAEALGSEYKAKKCGSLGTIGVVSFNGNKIVTTGGGGMVLTDDENIANKIRHLSTTAKINHRWKFSHNMPAHNYRLPNLNAALGLSQMMKINDRLKAKRNLAHRYITEFNNVNYCKIFQEVNDNKSNYWLNTMILNDTSSYEKRDYLLDGLNDAGYQVRPCWELLHTLPFHKNCPVADLETSEKLAKCIINLPSSAYLGC
jgi:perosamine synthetase